MSALRAWPALFLSLLVNCASDPSPAPPHGSLGGGAGVGGAATAGSTMAAGAGGGSDSSGSGGTAAGSAGSPSAGSAGAGGVTVGGGGAGGASAGGGGAGGGGNAGATNGGGTAEPWVGTWASAQQLTEDANEPPAPGLTNNTLRQIVRVSIGGQRIRLRFSNEHGSSPVTLNEAHVALSAGGSAISAGSGKALTFSGTSGVTIAPAQVVWSDALDFALEPLSKLAVSIHFGATSPDITGHPGSRTTSYLQAGNAAAATTLTSPVSTDHWYILSGIDVLAADARTLVILGDSITDGRGSTTNGNDRWPDALAERMKANAATSRIGLLNQGIGGNALLMGGLGPTGVTRFDADVLGQSGVRYVIVFEGVNDVGTSVTAASVTTAYQQLVTKARAAGLRIFGATILPFKGHSYYTEAHEAARVAVNAWIRTPGNFDAVIDLDAAARDPQAPDTLRSSYDSGDHLHLNPAGYKALASAVDLQLFQ